MTLRQGTAMLSPGRLLAAQGDRVGVLVALDGDGLDAVLVRASARPEKQPHADAWLTGLR
jgi:hypothetical protein